MIPLSIADKCPLQDLIHLIVHQLQPIEASQEIRKQYAWWILEAITRISRASLLSQSTITLSVAQKERLEETITRMVLHAYPLQYALGSVPFGALEIMVHPPILIPRPETEEWVMMLIDLLKPYAHEPLTILDMGTGSGCIGLALAHALPAARVVGADISVEALQLARLNASQLGINNFYGVESALFETVQSAAPFDLIVSNPPYISMSEYSHLDASVVQWEDHRALFAADQGMEVINNLIIQSKKYINTQNILAFDSSVPQLCIEIGYQQGAQTLDLCHQNKYGGAKIWNDMTGKPRLLMARINSNVDNSFKQ